MKQSITNYNQPKQSGNKIELKISRANSQFRLTETSEKTKYHFHWHYFPPSPKKSTLQLLQLSNWPRFSFYIYCMIHHQENLQLKIDKTAKMHQYSCPKKPLGQISLLKHVDKQKRCRPLVKAESSRGHRNLTTSKLKTLLGCITRWHGLVIFFQPVRLKNLNCLFIDLLIVMALKILNFF